MRLTTRSDNHGNREERAVGDHGPDVEDGSNGKHGHKRKCRGLRRIVREEIEGRITLMGVFRVVCHTLFGLLSTRWLLIA